MQWATQRAGTTFDIERIGFAERVGIEFDHRVEARAGIIDGGDPGEVSLRQCMAAEGAVPHALLQLGDVTLDNVEPGGFGFPMRA